MTRHVDLPATLLSLLGAFNPLDELSLGHDLLGHDPDDQVVVADWSRLCIRTEDVKASFPFKVSGAIRTETTGADDGPVEGPEASLPVRRGPPWTGPVPTRGTVELRRGMSSRVRRRSSVLLLPLMGMVEGEAFDLLPLEQGGAVSRSAERVRAR